MGAAIKYEPGERLRDSRLTYQHDVPKLNPKERRAAFICDCGTYIETVIAWVRHGTVSSCGCLKSEMVAEKNTKHSHAVRGKQSGAYRTWQAMHQRVKVDPNYLHLSICARWYDFENFIADMGDRPAGLTIERLNNNLGYEPSNCVWASYLTQAQNTRNTRLVIINGETHSINEWCRLKNIGYHVIKQRRARGMSLEDAITTPINTSKQGRKHL